MRLIDGSTAAVTNAAIRNAAVTTAAVTTDRVLGHRRGAPPASTDDPPVAMTNVEFTVPAALGALFADVVAEFSAWVPLGMDRRADGSFFATVRLVTGRRWRYRFLVDGERWFNDWNAVDYEFDDDGCGMSLLVT